MKDAQGGPAYGRTNWRRFAVAVGVPTVVAGGLVFGLANGALAANISVSSSSFKLSADKLDGRGFTQYSGQLETQQPTKQTGKNYYVAAKSGIKQADIYNLCQTVAVGPIVLRIEAGKDPKNPVKADDLLIGMSELGGDATFTNIDIGTDASTLSKDQAAKHGDVGGFGQEADRIVINNLRQTAYTTSATTFTLPGMNLKLYVGDGKECF